MYATGHVIEAGSRCALREDRLAEFGTKIRITAKGGHQHDMTLRWSQQDVKGHAALWGNASKMKCGDEAALLRREAVQRSLERVDETIINYELIEDVLEG